MPNTHTFTSNYTALISVAVKPLVRSILSELVSSLVINNKYDEYLAKAVGVLSQSAFCNYFIRVCASRVITPTLAQQAVLNFTENLTEDFIANSINESIITTREELSKLIKYFIQLVASQFIESGTINSKQIADDEALESYYMQRVLDLRAQLLALKQQPSLVFNWLIPHKPKLSAAGQLYFHTMVSDEDYLMLIDTLIESLSEVDLKGDFLRGKVTGSVEIAANQLSAESTQVIIDNLPETIGLIKSAVIDGISSAITEENHGNLIQHFLPLLPEVFSSQLISPLIKSYLPAKTLHNICSAFDRFFSVEKIKQIFQDHLNNSSSLEVQAVIKCFSGIFVAKKANMPYVTDVATPIRSFLCMRKLLSALKNEIENNRQVYAKLISTQISNNWLTRLFIEKYLTQLIQAELINKIGLNLLETVAYPFDNAITEFYLALYDFNECLQQSFSKTIVDKELKQSLLEKFDCLQQAAFSFQNHLSTLDQQDELTGFKQLPVGIINNKDVIINIISKGNISQYRLLHNVLQGYQGKLEDYIVRKKALINGEFKFSWWNSLVANFKYDKRKYEVQLIEVYNQEKLQNQNKIDTAEKIKQQALGATELINQIDSESLINYSALGNVPQTLSALNKTLTDTPSALSSYRFFGLFTLQSGLGKITSSLQSHVAAAAA